MEDIKIILYNILLFGTSLSEEALVTLLVSLADHSEISNTRDFIDEGESVTTLFVEESLKHILKGSEDDFINYFEMELVKRENFELLIYLDLNKKG